MRNSLHSEDSDDIRSSGAYMHGNQRWWKVPDAKWKQDDGDPSIRLLVVKGCECTRMMSQILARKTAIVAEMEVKSDFTFASSLVPRMCRMFLVCPIRDGIHFDRRERCALKSGRRDGW